MLSFFKRVFASLLGTLLGMSIFFSILLVGLIAFFYSLSDKKDEGSVNVKENSVLEIKLNAPIHERSQHDPLSELDVPVRISENSIGLVEIAGALEKAKNDPKIKGLYLHFGNPIASYASLEEIRIQIQKFKESGKFIIYFSDYTTEKALYLASIADERYVNPGGLVELNGLSVERQYYKKLLDKLEVEPIIFRVGKFKSAVEPFMRSDMSEASRLQTDGFITSIFNNYTKDIATDLSMEDVELRDIAHKLKIRKPEDAVELGVITKTAYEDEVLDSLRSRLSLEKDEKINMVHLSSYGESLKKGESSDSKVAVIIADGEIVMGRSEQGSKIGSDLAKTIRKVRQNKKVKAVVLRINSPGGSALASDIIWKEIVELKKEKPVIASMSDLAASGGYYIAMACDSILAYSTTITGSIGVFGLTVNLENFMRDKLGITHDRVKTSPFADIGSVNRAMTLEEKQIVQAEVDRIYADFTFKAALGRDMSVEDLREVAQGRVWSGEQGLEIGLVDQLGGFEDAIEIAASKAELEEYSLDYYPKPRSFVEQLVGDSYESLIENKLQDELGDYYQTLEFVRSLQGMDRVQARLPYKITIQ